MGEEVPLLKCWKSCVVVEVSVIPLADYPNSKWVELSMTSLKKLKRIPNTARNWLAGMANCISNFIGERIRPKLIQNDPIGILRSCCAILSISQPWHPYTLRDINIQRKILMRCGRMFYYV